MAVSLDGFVLTRWANASTENWKQEGAAPSGRDFLDGLSIPAKGYLLLGNTGAVLPSYAGADVSTNATPNFNGDDSVVLYDTSKGALGSTSAIADAVSFTDSGNEGANRSFYRISNAVGYDLNAGSTVLDFPGVWGEKSNADVDAAIRVMEGEVDLEKRNAAIAKAWKIVKDDISYLPLHHQVISWASKSNVNVPIRPNNEPLFRHAVVGN